MNADGSNPINLTNHEAGDSQPAFSPDGSLIAFTTNRNGGDFEIFIMNTDGSNPTNLSNNTTNDDTEPAFPGSP
jgi:TolB protein